jgi:alcohol dehydrogenase class IV
LNVTEDSLDFLAAEAFTDPNSPDNPRPADKAAMRRVLAAAMVGDLAGLDS